MVSLTKTIARGYAIIDKEGRLDQQRAKHLMASEAGGCIRRAWYSKRDPKASKDPSNGFAMRGKHGEKFLVDCLKRANAPVYATGEDQVSLFDEATQTGATPDGYLHYEDYLEGLEFKTVDPRTNKKNLPKKQHEIQLRLAMWHIEQATGIPMKVGHLVYMDASNYEDLDVFEVKPADKTLLHWVKGRARKVLRNRNVQSLDREGKTTGECKYCPYAEKCGVTAVEAGARTRGNKGSKLAGVGEKYLAAKDAEALAKKAKDALAEDIKKDLVARKTSHVEIAGISIDLQKTAGRVTLDKAAAAEAGIDLSPFEKTGKPSERLTVSRT